MLNLNFGTDPEVFSVVNRDGEINAISPALLQSLLKLKVLKVDDEFKHPVFIQRKKHSVMMDGVAWEFTFHEIFKNAKEMHVAINDALEDLEEYLSKLSYEGLKLSLYKLPVVKLNLNDYLSKLESFPIYQGFIFGCDQDYDAIEEEYSCKTVDVRTHEFRYGGGHFHISGDENLGEFPHPAIQLLAITVGNFCISKSPYKDLEIMRAKTYGRAGRFRPQKYPNGDVGVEYRAPSNSWISLPLEEKEKMFEYAYKAVEYLQDPKIGQPIIERFLPDTVNAINNADQELANKILGELG